MYLVQIKVRRRCRTGMKGRQVTDEELWKQMKNLANQEKSLEREMRFMLLLKEAYDRDMKLIMACIPDPVMPNMARQGYMAVDGKRFLVCFSRKQRAKTASYNTTWDIGSARELMNNMFNKKSVSGMVFNPNDEKMVIIFKDLLLMLMTGEKSKPRLFQE